MAKQQPIKKQPAISKPIVKTRTATKKSGLPSKDMFTYLEEHFSTNRTFYLILLVVLSIVFSFLCFDNKISLANDDALYIESGAKYATAFFAKDSWYTANAPLYPIVLGLIIKVIGVRLMWLKLFSVLCFAVSIYYIFRAFENRIAYIILIPALFLTAINSQFLMFASLTYTETFSLMIFGICFFVLFKIFDKLEAKDYELKSSILQFLLIGFLFFLMQITRSVALGAIGVLALFFVYRKRYSAAVASVVGFLVFYFIYKFAVAIIWKPDASQFATQTKLMLQKSVYDPSLGNEDLSGFIVRFWQNCQIYISSRFLYVLGFLEESSPVSVPITLVSIGLVAWATFLMHKKKQYILLFTTLFYVGLLAVTFITLNASWGQTRLIMIFLPFILFSVFYLMYNYGKQFVFLQPILPFLFFILFLVSISATFKQAAAKFPVFVENVTGDATFGYTPDWQNYIKMTKWCAANLPNDTKSIAVRKAPMSFIFSNGKEFFPIYNAPYSNTDKTADSLLNVLKTNKVNYFMPAELRADPNNYVENQIIGTVHRYMYFIQQKYPQVFVFVHQEGDLEKAQLFKINYAYVDSLKAVIQIK